MSTRRGFSLLEVTLVLSLLVVLAAFTWPLLQKPLASERLRKSADQLRTAWVRARLQAMSSGLTQVFHYVPESGLYTVEVYDSLEAEIEGAAASAWGTALDPQVPTTAPVVAKELPEDVLFVESVVDDVRAAATDPNLSADVATSSASSAAPIFFYPDGTTSSASIRLRNEHDAYIELHLRGLTGVVIITDVLSPEELAL